MNYFLIAETTPSPRTISVKGAVLVISMLRKLSKTVKPPIDIIPTLPTLKSESVNSSERI